MRKFLIILIMTSAVYAGGGDGEQKPAPPTIIVEPPKVEVIVEEGSNTLVQIVGIIVGAVVTLGVAYMHNKGWTEQQRKDKATKRQMKKADKK